VEKEEKEEEEEEEGLQNSSPPLPHAQPLPRLRDQAGNSRSKFTARWSWWRNVASAKPSATNTTRQRL